MHARFSQSRESRRPIRGTFYPSDDGSHSVGAVLPKLLTVLIAVAVVRTLIGVGKHHGRGGWSRRREALAELHRSLHAEDAKA